ncbi:isoleucine--tRNA ligase, partial [bacterium]|nr:isoleucine--tRNA ligase [bacterium]
GVSSKKEIEKLGIEKFNSACRKAVTRHVDDFEKMLTRLGRWADYEGAYFTMDKSYIETVWWVLKQIDKQGLLYEDFRVNAYCPRCGTPLSNFEVNQGYQIVRDTSIYVLFKVKGEKNTYFLVWTTTPWTLPGNLMLAVGDFRYVKVKVGERYFILAEERLPVLKERFSKVESYSAKDLEGKEYEPLYPEASKDYPSSLKKKSFRVYLADFVTLEEGTGVVHIAPAFGEEDMELGKKVGLEPLITVDEEGKMKVSPGKGKWVKEADREVIKDLKQRGLLYREETISHSYPFCWRCETPLLYYPIRTYFVKVSALREQLLKNNEKIHWVPGYLKHGRFGKWLAEAKDWAISRNRYWGAPLPIWKCQKCDYSEVIGSIQELKEKGAKIPKDLHRPYIDEVKYPCPQCGGEMKRTEEVFDCWFESGSMPYAQFHYPFENKEKTEKLFPADFIAEGLDQTRGWFYTLHVLATILTLKDIGLGKNQPAFKNVIVNGIILGEDGRKLSKRLGNYPDPNTLLSQYGADSIRFFLISSAPLGENYRFSERLVRLTFQNIILRYYNSYQFLEYILRRYRTEPKEGEKDLLDRWIEERLKLAYQRVINWMQKYELTKASREIEAFVADLSLWYIRRVKSKIIGKKSAEKKAFVLREVLKKFSVLSASFLPYLSEIIYQRLKDKSDPESVHLCLIEEQGKADEKILARMEKIREACSELLRLRTEHKIKVRQPLSSATVPFALNEEEASLIAEEVNVKEVKQGKEFALDTQITKELLYEGYFREMVRQIQDARKCLGLRYGEPAEFGLEFSEDLKEFFREFKSQIEKETRTKLSLRKGKKLKEFALGEGKVKLFQ